MSVLHFLMNHNILYFLHTLDFITGFLIGHISWSCRLILKGPQIKKLTSKQEKINLKGFWVSKENLYLWWRRKTTVEKSRFVLSQHGFKLFIKHCSWFHRTSCWLSDSHYSGSGLKFSLVTKQCLVKIVVLLVLGYLIFPAFASFFNLSLASMITKGA